MHIAVLIKQKPYENIEYVLRRHPLTFLPVVALFIIMLLVPVVVHWLINTLYPDLLAGSIFFPIAVIVACAYYLGALLFFYAQFVNYYLDLWVVTNDRIVDVEQLGLFSRTISELDLFRIQDVTADVHGFFPTIFHYGCVSVKTASPNINIVFHDVPRPNQIREHMIRLSHEDRKYHYTPPGETS